MASEFNYDFNFELSGINNRQLSSKGVSLAEQAVSKNLAVEVGNVTISKSQSSINNLIACY